MNGKESKKEGDEKSPSSFPKELEGHATSRREQVINGVRYIGEYDHVTGTTVWMSEAARDWGNEFFGIGEDGKVTDSQKFIDLGEDGR